jgi:DNA polymerase-3 subunit alpha
MNLEMARSQFAQAVVLQQQSESSQFVQILQTLLTAHRATEGTGLPFHICYRNDTAQSELVLGEAWRVVPSDNLIAELETTWGDSAVEIRY